MKGKKQYRSTKMQNENVLFNVDVQRNICGSSAIKTNIKCFVLYVRSMKSQESVIGVAQILGLTV